MTLGRIPSDYDPRNREHVNPRLSRRMPMKTNSVRHAMNAPHVDQFYTSGCVGFAGTNLLNCAAAVSSRRRWNAVFHNPPTRGSRYLTNDDGIENYTLATENDPFDWTYPPTDNGSSALGLMKAWKKYGIISGYDWCYTLNQFLGQLQHTPVLVGTEWFSHMTDAQLIARPTGESQSDHEYLATQIIWKTKLIGFENSWGDGWGPFKGRFFMTFAGFETLLLSGGDAVAPRLL